MNKLLPKFYENREQFIYFPYYLRFRFGPRICACADFRKRKIRIYQYKRKIHTRLTHRAKEITISAFDILLVTTQWRTDIAIGPSYAGTYQLSMIRDWGNLVWRFPSRTFSSSMVKLLKQLSELRKFQDTWCDVNVHVLLTAGENLMEISIKCNSSIGKQEPATCTTGAAGRFAKPYKCYIGSTISNLRNRPTTRAKYITK